MKTLQRLRVTDSLLATMAGLLLPPLAVALIAGFFTQVVVIAKGL